MGPQVANETQPARGSAWQAGSPVNRALDHPEARAAFVQQEVLNAKAKFARFFKAAGLNATEQDAFLKRLSEFAEAKLDLVAEVRAKGYGPMNPPQDPQAYLELFRADHAVDAVFADQLRTLLGDERYQEFAAHRRSIPETNVADRLVARLFETDAPLTIQQASQLVSILQEERFREGAASSPHNTLNGVFVSSSTRGGALGQSNLIHGNVMMPGLDWLASITDAAMKRAEAVLSPNQLAELRQLQVQQTIEYRLAPPAPPQPDVATLLGQPKSGK